MARYPPKQIRSTKRRWRCRLPKGELGFGASPHLLSQSRYGCVGFDTKNSQKSPKRNKAASSNATRPELGTIAKTRPPLLCRNEARQLFGGRKMIVINSVRDGSFVWTTVNVVRIFSPLSANADRFIFVECFCANIPGDLGVCYRNHLHIREHFHE